MKEIEQKLRDDYRFVHLSFNDSKNKENDFIFVTNAEKDVIAEHVKTAEETGEYMAEIVNSLLVQDGYMVVPFAEIATEFNMLEEVIQTPAKKSHKDKLYSLVLDLEKVSEEGLDIIKTYLPDTGKCYEIEKLGDSCIAYPMLEFEEEWQECSQVDYKADDKQLATEDEFIAELMRVVKSKHKEMKNEKVYS